VLKLSLVIFVLIGLAFSGLGVVYLTANEFMPYHSAAIQTPWTDLDANHRGLYLGFLKGLGSGSVIVGIATISMVILSLMKSVGPYIHLLPGICIGYSMLLGYSIYTVHTETVGEPPLSSGIGLITMSVVATILLWLDYRARTST